ncbi:MAG: hypothetical protein KF709_01855 [Gemmatimonadaceae bacterium]|nr:hypothetical protein [Gemmatimonadaceae bacterium]
MPIRPASRLLLPLVVASVACADAAVGVPGRVRLETNSPDYHAEPGEIIGGSQQYVIEMVVGVTNDTGRPIELQSCADVGNTPRLAVSMAAIANDWASAYENISGCENPSHLPLAVGESRVDRIELIGPRTFDSSTGDPLGNLEGWMRLAYYADGLVIWSNAFEVRLRPVGE